MRNLVPSMLFEHIAAGTVRGRIDAVVLFVDTSGFTPLTRRLSAQGHDGAEVLAEILLAVFAPLVETVYAHGGFIVGFAGDAFKAVFPGLAATQYRQALAAAEQIRTHMADRPSHATRYGHFTFSVRISIAAGTVDWSIWATTADVAQSHGYTFAGIAIDRAVQGEDYAAGGELVVTESVLAVLQSVPALILTAVSLADSAVGYVRVQQVQLDDVVTVVSPAPVALASVAEHFYPATLLNMQAQGEFRPVYTLFVNVATLPEPGGADDFLPTFFELLDQYGGYLCRIGQIGADDPGGTFLLFWGAPTGHENDLTRVLSFVLAVQRAIAQPLRAGITHGLVYAGFIGSALCEEYTAYGTSVNQAARQMGVAAWGEILLDAECAGFAQDEFELSVAGRYPLKGLAAEQPLFALQGQKSQQRMDAYGTSLVGRGPELSALHAAVQPIFQQRFGGIILVEGEAGIGKSRLVYEFLMEVDLHETVQILVGQVDEILRESLNPFRYFLYRYFEQLPSVDDPINQARFTELLDELIAETAAIELRTELDRTRSFLGALVNLHWSDSLYEQLNPQLRFENTLGALKTLIKAESLRRPVILLLEDGHWLDGDSSAFLAQLVRNVDEFPFAVLVTARPTDHGGVPTIPLEQVHHTLTVGGFATADLPEFVQEHLGSAASAELIALLTVRGEGNPFFTEQLLLYLQEKALMRHDVESAAWQLVDEPTLARSLPDSVQALLIARLDQLSQEVKQVVQTAAVLGREFSVQVLSQILRNDAALTDKVQLAQDAAVWNALTQLRYLFRHALLRDAAYEMQLRTQLRVLHQIAAEAFEQLYADNLSAYYADLVYHYHHAEMVEQERHFATLAGAQALRQFANRDAVTFLTRALELAAEDALDERYQLLTQLVKVFQLQGERAVQEETLADMRNLAETLQNLTYQSQVQLAYTEYYAEISDFPAAVAAAQQAIALAEQCNDLPLQSEGYEQWGRALWPQARYEESRDMAVQALTLARTAGLGEREANALVVQGIALWYLGDYAAAQKVFEESIAIYGELDMYFAQASPLINLALIAQNLGDHHRALEYLHAAQEHDQRRGARRELAIIATNMGLSYRNIGDYGQAETIQQQALADFTELNDRFGQIVASANLGTISVVLGNYLEGRRYLDDALAICREIGSRGQEAGVLATLSEVDVVEGAYDEAYTKATEAVAIAEEISHRGTTAKAYTKLGQVLLARQELATAVTAFTTALSIRHELNETKQSMEIYAGLAQCAVAVGDPATTRAHVQEILGFLQENTLDDTINPFPVYLVCYQVLAADQNAQAVEILRRGHRALQERAATIASDNRRRSFLENVAVNRELVETYRHLA